MASRSSITSAQKTQTSTIRHNALAFPVPLLTTAFVIHRHFLYLLDMKEVAVGIILRNGKVLACQRTRSVRYPLKWEFPGGKIEAGERPAETLTREFREELGISPSACQEFHRQEWIYPEGVSDPEHEGAFRVFYYLVPGYRGTVVNNVFEQIRWVTPKELLTMDILEGNKEIVTLLATHAPTLL